ncbi:MAG TPA: DUF4416 domain-containing protein [Syntrophus sp. (in: bacteria)]|nr:DUF4416 domain-containing protein [Syntrophus sp. (in: bacteria)]
MSRLATAPVVKLIMSVLSPAPDLIGQAVRVVSDLYGEADFVSALLPFDYTDYYAAEMGAPLYRRFVAFERLMPPETLPDVKRRTLEAEEQWTEGGRRRVNIDPGYLAEAHLILATGKGYAHRPYLRDGVYADLTLVYQRQAFRPLAWTYPDYGSPDVRALFEKIRAKYLLQRKETRL